MAFPSRSPFFPTTFSFFFFFFFFFLLKPTVNGSLFPPPLSHPLALDELLWPDRLPDPFKILEHLPIDLQRDELITSPARVDWKETPQNHIIILDVPGFRKHELKIEAIEENHELRVTGERSVKEEEANSEKWHCSERSYGGKFFRQFRLPGDVDLESVKAKLEDGVLRVWVGKFSPERVKGPKVIPVAVSDESQGSVSSVSPAANDEL